MKKTIKTGLVALLTAATISGCATIDKYNPVSGRNEYASLPKVIVYMKEGDNLKDVVGKYVDLEKYDLYRDIVPVVQEDNLKFRKNLGSDNFILIHVDKDYCVKQGIIPKDYKK